MRRLWIALALAALLILTTPALAPASWGNHRVVSGEVLIWPGLLSVERDRLGDTGESRQDVAPAAAWQVVTGIVVTVSDTTMLLRGDDGRSLTVDASRIRDLAASLQPGQHVTIVGVSRGDDLLVAHSIARAAIPSALPRIGPREGL